MSNYKRQTERRISFKFAVSHATPADKAREVPQMVKQERWCMDAERAR